MIIRILFTIIFRIMAIYGCYGMLVQIFCSFLGPNVWYRVYDYKFLATSACCLRIFSTESLLRINIWHILLSEYRCLPYSVRRVVIFCTEYLFMYPLSTLDMWHALLFIRVCSAVKKCTSWIKISLNFTV